MKNYYYILGIEESSSIPEIKKAYRKLSLKFHPDKNNGDTFFEERFKEIQEAYETLLDPLKRKAYNSKFSGFSQKDFTNQRYNSFEEQLRREHESLLQRERDKLNDREKDLAKREADLAAKLKASRPAVSDAIPKETTFKTVPEIKKRTSLDNFF